MAVARTRPVSGRYSGAEDRFAIELRVDVDGPRPTNRVSADYYRDGRHLGSMRVEAPRITFDPGVVTIVGRGSFTWQSPSPIVRVTIPRVSQSAKAAPATLSHFTPIGGAAAEYTCDFESSHFRRVELYEAREKDVAPFSSYDTASLPCRGPRRDLSLKSAYAEAGIELASVKEITVIEPQPGATDDTWSDAELHAAMAQYFSQQDTRPQWAIWLLHAWSHDDPGVFGLMFDRSGLQRQGCAVFYKPISDPGAAYRRAQLHTCVHELGHAFNLLHSWQKSRARPPVPGRPAAASWMNYPLRYPGGPAAFWPQFPFEFDQLELAHLRHGFQEDVIMGGSPFEGGAALRGDDDWAGDERINRGLRMRISAPPTFGVGVPVTIGIELAATTEHGQTVPEVIGPRAGNVSVRIRRPDGKVVPFEPLLTHCHGDDAARLSARQPPRRDYAYLHYGKDGFAFERPGRYAIHARHVAADGSTVRSNVLRIDVQPPVTREDRELSRMVAGNDDLGALLSLSGSAAPAFDGANTTLDEVIERYPSRDLASIARVVRATSLARPFKVVAPDEALRVRPAQIGRAEELIKPVLDLPTVYRGMSAEADLATQQRAVAAALVRLGTRQGVSTTVDSFVNSRRLEIAGVISSPQMATQTRATDPVVERPYPSRRGAGRLRHRRP